MSRKFKFVSKHKKPKLNLGYSEEEKRSDFSSHIEIFSDNELIVEGCRGVFEYRSEYIKLKLKKGSVIVCGENFDIAYFEESTISIKGRITNLEFCV